ncbi:MFS general substrate transporter [Lactarius quietus]|nr:MFS general substrate transporter [Lactarius quietus]
MPLPMRQHDNPEFVGREAPGDANIGSLPPSKSVLYDVESGKSDDTTESSFTLKEKWFIVGLASLAALFSPFTANIYLPVIPTVARDFHRSIELINLSVTMYMISQGISPMLWGTLSDRRGRRPIMIVCLAVLSLSCVGLALVPTSAYWLLMLLRCFQAAGSASTFAIGAGIISDISTRAERAGFVGLYGLGPLVGPALGPVIGGALAQSFSWRATFWFLCISSAICCLVIFLILPETLRAIVGDGSVQAGCIYTPAIPVVGRNRVMKQPSDLPPREKLTNPFKMFIYPDVFILLFFNGTYYAVLYGVTASLSISFEETYPYLTQTDIGLCFLAIWDSHNSQAHPQAQTEPKKAIDRDSGAQSFLIERVRLQLMPYLIVIYTTCVIGYGWSLQAKTSIAVPLALQFIIGATFVAVMNAITSLLVDLVPEQGSSITACNDVVRCLMGAGMVTIINPIITAMGNGWAYVLLGGFCVLVASLMWVEARWGHIWREQRLRVQEKAISLPS